MESDRPQKLREFGRLIKKIRKEAGLGTRQLASLAGIRRRLLQGLEGGAPVNRQIVVKVLFQAVPIQEKRKAFFIIIDELWAPRRERRRRLQSTRRRDMRKQARR